VAWDPEREQQFDPYDDEEDHWIGEYSESESLESAFESGSQMNLDRTAPVGPMENANIKQSLI